jgi:hypothetical protein
LCHSVWHKFKLLGIELLLSTNSIQTTEQEILHFNMFEQYKR